MSERRTREAPADEEVGVADAVHALLRARGAAVPRWVDAGGRGTALVDAPTACQLVADLPVDVFDAGVADDNLARGWQVARLSQIVLVDNFAHSVLPFQLLALVAWRLYGGLLGGRGLQHHICGAADFIAGCHGETSPELKEQGWSRALCTQIRSASKEPRCMTVFTWVRYYQTCTH